MPTLNKVFLTGNVVRDFEKKTDKLGVVSIAQNIWNGTEEVAHFYNVVLLGEKNVQSAEKVIKKGANITIEGSLENNSYEKDGKKIESHYIKLTCDVGEDMDRVFFKDKDMANLEKYKRGMVGTFFIRVDVEEGFGSKAKFLVTDFKEND